MLWFCGPNPCITPEALDRLPACRHIFRSGSGLDAVPVEAARARGIGVHNTPESIAESVAEHAVALLLALVRQVTVQDGRFRAQLLAGLDRQTQDTMLQFFFSVWLKIFFVLTPFFALSMFLSLTGDYTAAQMILTGIAHFFGLAA